MDKKVAIPSIGKYTEPFRNMLMDLGCNNVMETLPMTQEMIDDGCRHSPEMFCYPYKHTLGYFMKALDNGAEIILMFDSAGQCRLKHYHKLQDYTLRQIGYDNFKMIPFKGNHIIKSIRTLNNKVTLFQIFKAFRKTWKEIKRIETYNIRTDKFNIGIIGEVYCCMETSLNFHIEDKIKKAGMNPYNAVTMSRFIKGYLQFHDKYHRQALKYFSGKLGGHGIENVANVMKMAENKFDGIIWFRPLSCFVGDSSITTENYNSKQIKNIKIGEKVLTHKGNFKKVIKTMRRRYLGKILDVNCGGILRFKITPEHPVLALQRKYVKLYKRMLKEPHWIEIKELNKNDFIAITKPKETINKDYMKNEVINNNPSKYKDMSKYKYNKGMLRVLGYYLAEGTLCYDKSKGKIKRKYLTSVRFIFNEKETYFMEDITNILKENNIDCGIIVYNYKTRPNSADLSVYNRSFAHFMKNLGGSYCDKKEIHPEIMNLPSELQLEVAKGFFRGDGCFTDKYGGASYRGITTSFKLAEQLFWILIRNNIKCSISEQNIKDKKPFWNVQISNVESIKRMNDKLIQPTQRQNNVRFLETDEYFLIPIRDINFEHFKGFVYNLEVEDNNSFVANKLTVHNCMSEVTVDPIIRGLCEKNSMPLLVIDVDETSAEANVNTRIETFFELINTKRFK